MACKYAQRQEPPTRQKSRVYASGEMDARGVARSAEVSKQDHKLDAHSSAHVKGGGEIAATERAVQDREDTPSTHSQQAVGTQVL